MTKLRVCKVGWLLLLLCAASSLAVSAQTFTTLFKFDGQANGGRPDFVSFAQGTDGSLYGTTGSGGNGGGTVFKITPQGELTTVYKFCSLPSCADGNFPGGLILATDGNFYGTTLFGGNPIPCSGGCGTVFKMTLTGALTTIYSFCVKMSYNCDDGQAPGGALLQATDGNFYGTTEVGGQYCDEDGCGTAFKITPGGDLTTLASFGPIGGANPAASLIEATDGNLYSTTGGGVDYFFYGSAYEITRQGQLVTLYSFCSKPNCTDGEFPSGPVTEGFDGNLYGTTGGGQPATGNFGTMYKLMRQGKVTTLHGFCAQPNCMDGAGPAGGLVLANDGNFYGVTSFGGSNFIDCNAFGIVGCGTIFKMTPSGKLTVLHSFDLADGQYPNGLFQSTNGTFYGTTSNAATFDASVEGYGEGTVFSLDVGLGPFVRFVQAAGKVGKSAEILGQDLTGTISVSFNGIPADFDVVSDTYLTATVPSGATTGYVTVTTPTGVLTSNVPFHVIP